MSLLYHYTNTAGFMGIIESNSIWATNINFLNDYQEMKEGIEIFRKHLLNEPTFKDVPDNFKEQAKELITAIYSIVKNYESDIYLTSFTEDRDYLRQWMSYCQYNDGICLGLNQEKLQIDISKLYHNRTQFLFEKITYSDENDFKEFINLTTMLSIFDTNIIITEGDKEEQKKLLELDKNTQQYIFGSYFIALISEAILKISTFKPKEFQDEKEFRLAIFNIEKKFVKYRSRNGYIIPYLAVPFTLNAIEEVILSPSIDFELRKKGIESFLKSKNIECKITKSNCSLREF